MDFKTTQMREARPFFKAILPTRFIGLNPKLKIKVPIITQSLGGFCVAPHQFKVTTATQPCGLQSYKSKTGHLHFAAFKEDDNLVLAKKGSSSGVIEDQEKDGSAKMSTRLRKKSRESPEGLLRHGLDMCSKGGDLVEALRLYDNALEGGVKFDQYNYNVLLYLCSSAAMGVLRPAKSGSESIPGRIELSPGLSIDEKRDKDYDGLEDNAYIEVTKEMQALALQRGCDIYDKMRLEKVPPNEATFTSVARLAAAKGDGDLAFNMLKQMAAHDITPRLRSYSPALFTFCKNKEVEKAYEVDCHMRDSGVEAEEPELAGLLKLSGEAGRESKVYSLLHRLRTSVRQVNPSTANVIEQWFKSTVAAQVGSNWNAKMIRKVMESRGGGWHGLGWMNTGEWRVEHTTMKPKGVCRCCGEQLVTIDIDPKETERFAKSVADLASQRERKSNFTSFQEWLDNHGPYEVIIDGANVGLYRQNYHGDGFFSQLNAVVNGIRERSPSKRWPLVILHNKRTREGPAKLPQNKQLINKWKTVGALYTTPTGSNDDWYWLYAAVKFKCLIVTVDEMRDHIFGILGNDFFPKWKERHQVRFTLTRYGPEFYMPPPYSIVIQESERGSWHIPIVGGDDIEMPRKWLCITRPEKKWHPSQAFQAGSHLDSKLSKIEGVDGAVIGQSAAASDKIKVPRVDKKNKKDLSDVYTEPAPVTAEVSMQKNRSSLSIQFKCKKNRQHNSPSEPSSPPASVTLKKIEAAEKHVDFAIDFQI